MFGVDTPAQTFLWKALNEIVEWRTAHLRGPAEIRLSEPDWNQVVAGSHYYPPDDDDPDNPLEKIYYDPATVGDVGELFGVKAIKDESVAVGDVRLA